MSFEFVVVTPERPVVDARAESVVVPGAEGEFGVLPEHEPFLAPLVAGELRFTTEEGTHSLRITGGFAEVSQERVTILASAVEGDSEE